VQTRRVHLADLVSDWYRATARDLPWRRPGTTPWGVLVSEFMLQQTPVARVEPIWTEWLQRWPRPSELADAPRADVLRAWGRLGYPRRALRLHEAAQAIALLDQVRLGMTPGAGKREQARYFELRAYLRQGQRDERGAIEDLQTAVSLWPTRDNGAVKPLRDYYVKAGEAAALDALQARLKR